MNMCPILFLHFSTVGLELQRNILQNSSAMSAWYNILLSDCTMKEVYCDMDGSNCDGIGGWTRIALANMTEPGFLSWRARERTTISNGIITCGSDITLKN